MAIQDVIRMLEQERNRIDAAIKALKGVGVDSTAPAAKTAKAKGRRKKRRISAEARVKMAEAARKRWAAKKAAEKKAVAKKTVTK